jgi:inosine/xanthosine triphosphatase
MKIMIASLNPVKQTAAQSVLTPLYPDATFEVASIPSGVPAQPWGDAETRAGAITRARNAVQHNSADLGIGFEGGLIRTEQGIMTCAWCAIAARDGRIGVGGGSHMMLPPAAGTMLDDGLELGIVMDRLTGLHNTKHDQGAIGILTDGLESRATAYAHILRLALAPFRSAAYYQESPR